MRYLMCTLILIGGLALPEFVGSGGQANATEEEEQRVKILRNRLNELRFALDAAAKNARAGHPTNMKILYGKGSARRQKIMETIEAYEKAMVAAGVNPKDARYRAQDGKESMLSRMEPPPCK